MKKSMLCSLLAMLLSGLSLPAQSLEITQTDFSSPAIPSGFAISTPWKVQNGVLSCLSDGVSSFTLDSRGRSSFDIEFKMRMLKHLQKEQHFGFIFKTASESIRLYSRGGNFILWIPSLKMHEQFGTPFSPALQPSAQAKWHSFKLQIRNNVLTVLMNGKQIATMNRLPQGFQKISFYAYNEQMEVDDLKLTLLPSEKKN